MLIKECVMGPTDPIARSIRPNYKTGGVKQNENLLLFLGVIDPPHSDSGWVQLTHP